MNKKQMLQRLVDNAFDFLYRAVEDLDTHPKFSLISFYSAVELFLKARLLVEHWTLVVANKQEPDLEKFQKGDFQSVTLDTANERLTKVALSGLSVQELKVFKDVGNHRNQMVHFFHMPTAKAEADEARRNVVRQQLTAWYFLHRLLIAQWKSTFSPWEAELTKLDKLLRKQKDFLRVVFDQKAGDIADQKSKGSLVLKCPSCSFKAQIHESSLNTPYRAECLVCGFVDTCISIECTDCSRHLRFFNDGHASCKCGKSFDPEELACELTDAGAAHIAAMEGDDSHDLANCSECDGYHTVARLEDETYFCASCFGSFDSVEWCGWCNEPNTGDMEGSTWNGCNHCDGKAGWDRD